MKKVIVYSTSTCPHCIQAKKFFDDNRIQYENFDVSIDSSKIDEMVKKSGQMGVPVIDIEGAIIVGFDKTKILKLLEIS